MNLVSSMTVQKIDHTFHQQRLSYDAVPNTQPCIKISFFFNKLPNVSYEQFHRHWETVHADLTMQVVPLYSNKIQRYVQVSPISDRSRRHISGHYFNSLQSLIVASFYILDEQG